MAISRLGERIATALQNNTISEAEATELIATAKTVRWTPALKAEVEAMLARPGTSFEGAAKSQLQSFVASRPVQTDLADPKPLTKDATNLSWNPVENGKLFIDGVNFDDVAQGYIGDCYLAASLSAVAKANPKAIEDAIKDNGNGTYTVRFFESQGYGRPMKPVTFTIDDDVLARTPGSRSAYMHARDDKELWPALLEKAYAQWKGGFDAIGNGGNGGDVMTAITGKPATYFSNVSTSSADMFSKLKAATASNRPMGAATYGEDHAAKYTGTGVHAWHMYTILGATEDAGQQFVIMRNPWGYSEPGEGSDGKNDGIFKLPFKDFMSLYIGTTISE